ncbi:MAG TPA: signal recognition particle-docking protein FtsY [Candidatus Cloacimonadota bacterium]|nr:signal recognition particle-docking protein FtsY [Candidatus Cloacimonadota bacterium]
MLSIVRSLRQKLAKTKSGFLGKIAEAISLRGKVDEELMEEIEDILLRSDTGFEMSQLIVEQLREKIRFEKVTEVSRVQEILQEIMQEILLKDNNETENILEEIDAKPYIMAFVGVNGVGKTTSIGKIAHKLVQQGKKVMIVAGDTWRAAAIEQLEIWAQRSGAIMVKSQTGGDPASVIYDGISSALAKGIDVVLIDTAGRQHTKDSLMKELSKIDRTIKKLIPEAPHQVLLVVDSTTGQNAISQAQHFNEVIPLSGLVLSKFDGTAKGGIIFNLKHNLNLPVKLIGVGEGIDDLEVFNIHEFITAFFTTNKETDDENQALEDH